MLDRPVGGSGVASIDVIIVHLTDSDGIAGLGFSYVLGGGGAVVLRAAQDQLSAFLRDQPLQPPQASWRRIAASFNRTGHGPNMIALAAIDVATWDLEARRRGVPLGTAMGGTARPVAVYASGDFNATQTPAEAVRAAASHVERGFKAVKPRVSGDRSNGAVLSEMRRILGGDIEIMVDANEKCDLPGAHRLLSAARDQGIFFVEEPLPSSALQGYRSLAASHEVTIATGEHLQGRTSFLPFITEGIAGVIQPDLAMCGGLTPAMELAVLAEAFDVVVSPHFLPGLFVHIAAAFPAIRWLEDFPLLEPLFDGWPAISKGRMEPTGEAGHGLSLKSD